MSQANDSGNWTVCRHILLASRLDTAQREALTHELASQPGVSKVSWRGRHPKVCYDLRESGYLYLETVTENAGFAIDGGLLSRMRRHFYAFLDETGRENAALPPPTCCSDPKTLRR